MFTADRDGLYYFYFYLEVDALGLSVYGHRKNGVIQCSGEGGGHSPDEMMMSCGSVLELVSGDEIYVTTDPYDNPFQSPGSCGFTGFLIHEYN